MFTQKRRAEQCAGLCGVRSALLTTRSISSRGCYCCNRWRIGRGAVTFVPPPSRDSDIIAVAADVRAVVGAACDHYEFRRAVIAADDDAISKTKDASRSASLLSPLPRYPKIEVSDERNGIANCLPTNSLRPQFSLLRFSFVPRYTGNVIDVTLRVKFSPRRKLNHSASKFNVFRLRFYSRRLDDDETFSLHNVPQISKKRSPRLALNCVSFVR